MQGTTRAIFDTASGQSNNFTFFQNVQTRPYPFSNISQNRFEVGESLAIESIALILFEAGYPEPGDPILNFLFGGQCNPLLNLYIGNQRVIKDLDLSYSNTTLGQTNTANNPINGDSQTAVFRLETPIVIPPQIEFYATLQFSTPVGPDEGTGIALILQGTGTLLNPKSNF
jgi:hypothetical protein